MKQHEAKEVCQCHLEDLSRQWYMHVSLILDIYVIYATNVLYKECRDVYRPIRNITISIDHLVECDTYISKA